MSIPAPDHPNAARVAAAMAEAGFPVEVVHHEVSARTAEEAAAAVGVEVGAIVKSLVFVAGDEPVLALVSGPNRLDAGKLAAIAGAAVGRADAAVVRTATGYPIGGVAPLGFPAPLRTWIDEDLLSYGVVWAAAGTPHHVFPIPPADLVTATGAIAADLAER